MTGLARDDVVLVPFGFTEQSGTKWRSAVVISVDRYNQTTPDLPISSITGNLNAISHSGDYARRDWQAAGPLKPSLVQTNLSTRLFPVSAT